MARIYPRFAFAALTAALLAFGAGIPRPATAQITDVSQVMELEVLPGWRRADGVHVAGLRITLKPGWKTYWRAAGAAGISPQMNWRGSDNMHSVTPMWPTPQVFRQGGSLSIGFDRDFILPLLIAPRDAGPIRLNGVLDVGVCADICLPARLSVAAVLEPLSSVDRRIEAALADRPRRLRAAARCQLRPTADGMSVTGQIDVPRQGTSETVVFEVPDPTIWVTDADTVRQGDRITGVAEMLVMGEGELSVDRSDILITVIGDRGAVEVMGCTG
ncbi:MAG: protein-disulfide reductase DsbD domain-containing protein [Jannaschia helgolandensis]|uniref:protein-disulfide reductase DsbD domain-containing protein n=1 Tax=Jannaschia helgolandensis TaxID=188906 RepID=UPI003C7528F5